MAVWSTDDWDKPDFALIQNGFVHKFHSPDVLATAANVLAESGYRVVKVDASRWEGSSEMHRDIAAALSFPDYYGKNLNALDDCLDDVARGDYGWNASDRGLVFVIDNIDNFWASEPEVGFALLDIYNRNASLAALYGNRLMCLVRSDDARWDPPSFGAYRASWNPAEWMDKNRGA
jgi:hypothetical protein